jgi:hypothetical protein
MSTPISRDNKLQGLELYAPRRAREQSLSDGQAAPPEASEPLETDQTAGPVSADASNNAVELNLLDWVDQAIREVVELGHPSGDLEAVDSALETPQSPPVAPVHDESDEWLPPSSPPLRQAYRSAAAVPPKRSRLDPEIVPQPPVVARRNSVFPPFLRLSLVIALAAIVAYGLTAFYSQWNTSWFKPAGDRIAETEPSSHEPVPPPASRLIVEDQQAFANEPLSLVVDVAGGKQNETLLVDGLAEGTTLSAGTSASPTSWRLPSDKLRGLRLYAPKDFVGIMNTTVNLLGPDSRILDSRSVQLKWIAKEPKPAPVPVAAPARVEATAGDPTAATKSALPRVEPMAPAEAAMLMQRGRDSLSAGDVSAARVAFGRLADAGSADAALALADTYDPEYLAEHNFVGTHGDRATARAMYQRAKELGSAEAGRILARVTGN